MRFFLIAVVLALNSGCTASQAFAVTGDSLTATGKQYLATGEAMINAVDQGKITPAQFHAWRQFSDKFELVWDTSATAWQRAREAKKQIDQGEIEAALAGIAAELLGFYLKAQELGLVPELKQFVPKGAP